MPIRFFQVFIALAIVGCSANRARTTPEINTASAKSISLGSFPIQVHSEEVLPRVKASYRREDLRELKVFLAPVTRIKIRNGLIQAADRKLDDPSRSDPTHYDAVWLRDSLWGYLGLKAQGRGDDAKLVLRKMLDYVSTPGQLARFREVIADPSVLAAPDGPMHAVHIRFDGNSSQFHDVMIDGKPQQWNHKQNDALGLLLDLSLRALASREIALGELSPSNWEALSFFPKYFAAIRFYEMEDAGAWEEIERINSSSIGLVTSGLERLRDLLRRDREFRAYYRSELSMRELERLVDHGYYRIEKQLKAGGESPMDMPGSPRYRQADAALLNLIYPAKLSRLKRADKEKIIAIVQPLIGEVGIRRYLGDSYQSAGFWQQPAGDISSIDEKTSDTSSAQDFTHRGKRFIEGSEAQWFFDSWYSKAMGVLYRETKEPRYRADQVRFFNRALGQITGGEPGRPVLGADGKPVPRLSLPESYNTVLIGKNRLFAPSPITPLNWAKASLSIALEELEKR